MINVLGKALPKYLSGLMFAIALVSISSSSILIKLSSAEPIAISFWRSAFSLFLFIPPVVSDLSRNVVKLECSRLDVILMFISGLSLASHFILWISSLFIIDIATSVTLVTMYPLISAVMGLIIFNEKPTLLQIAAFILAFIGVYLILQPKLLILEKLFGALIALIAAIFAAIYFSIGRIMRKKYSLSVYVLMVYGIASSLCFIYGIATGVNLVNYDKATWLYLFLIALVPMILGHTVLNYLLKFFKAYVVTSVALGEPAGATFLAFLIFSEVPELITIIGMVLSLTGVFLIIFDESRKS